MTKFICSECGNDEDTENWLGGDKLLEAGLCLNCEFWLDIINNTEPVVIEGSCYTIGPEDIGTTDRWWRGFGGRSFVIKFTDGRTVNTTNLFHRGKVPDRFRERMQDNAKFVS